MKQRIVLAMLFLLLLLLIPSALAQDDTARFVDIHGVAFSLPADLKRIDDEAFVGTAAVHVVMPAGVEYIGDRAFAYSRRLVSVYIPKTTKYIGKDAFSKCEHLVIHGVPGSYAEDWARKHGIPFVRNDIWNGNGRIIILRFSDRVVYRTETVDTEKQTTNQTGWRKGRERSMRPKERAELHPIDYRFP